MSHVSVATAERTLVAAAGVCAGALADNADMSAAHAFVAAAERWLIDAVRARLAVAVRAALAKLDAAAAAAAQKLDTAAAAAAHELAPVLKRAVNTASSARARLADAEKPARDVAKLLATASAAIDGAPDFAAALLRGGKERAKHAHTARQLNEAKIRAKVTEETIRILQEEVSDLRRIAGMQAAAGSSAATPPAPPSDGVA